MMLVRWIISKSPSKQLTEEQVRKSLHNIKKRKYIKIVPASSKKGETNFNIELTNKGKEILKSDRFRDLSISRPETWDGKWRFVIFDVPEKYRRDRDILRDKLKKLNFFQIQKSVWVHPYDCEKEIELLTEYFGVTQHVLSFATSIKRDDLLKEYFEKQGFGL